MYKRQIKTTVDGQQYITARGWEDLSSEIQAYERNGFPVTQELIMEMCIRDRYFVAYLAFDQMMRVLLLPLTVTLIKGTFAGVLFTVVAFASIIKTEEMLKKVTKRNAKSILAKDFLSFIGDILLSVVSGRRFPAAAYLES